MYELTWITEQLATGHAPMSYAELDAIREQGVTAIVNLCGEFCDLHEIEEKSGFEVYYLPVADECAPDLEEMEKALEWLDEAVYLKKKVLVHCRHGIGRTGTFVSAYLLRRGLGLKLAEKAMKGKRATPTNYEQWRFLKKYGKQSGTLQAKTPTIDNRVGIDTTPMLEDYIAFVAEIDARYHNDVSGDGCCGHAWSPCCRQPFDLLLIESIFISQMINKKLNHAKRQEVIHKAVKMAGQLKALHHQNPGMSQEEFHQLCHEQAMHCPLVDEQGECLLFSQRPLRCRLWDKTEFAQIPTEINEGIRRLSQNAYLALTGTFPPSGDIYFSSADTMSGKFVQVYFQAMTDKR